MKLSNPSFKLHLYMLAVVVLAASCTVHRVEQEPALTENVPANFSSSGSFSAPAKWWKSFKDPVLDRLIDEALNNNFDIKSAWARLQQAEALARKSGAYRIPEVTLLADAWRGRTFNSLSADRTANNFALDAVLSYEIDLWRRLSSIQNAAELDVLSTRENLEALAIILAAQVADSWYTILEQRGQLSLLQEQRAASRTFLDLVELRFGQGQASAVDVYQQREQLASTETRIPLAQLQLQLESHRLAVLLGRAPTDTDFENLGASPSGQQRGFPARSILSAHMQKFPQLGLPLSVLQQRPDVRAAKAQVVAADYRVAAAIADRFPAIRIAGSSGYQSRDSDELFNNWLWSLAAGLTAPLIDGGKRREEVRAREAVLKEKLLNYQSSILEALREVEDAISYEQQQSEFVLRLEKQLEYGKAAFTESQQRYATGLSAYLSVLTALLTQQGIERTLITAKKDLISSRIALYKALGGTWTNSLVEAERVEAKKQDKK